MLTAAEVYYSTTDPSSQREEKKPESLPGIEPRGLLLKLQHTVADLGGGGGGSWGSMEPPLDWT